ncbi:hypothetical protein CDIK_0411 [Cucumispora dikerogammari]|nr:hypothetical protein CDIK_0411 [Cucumispora dikerogammari]
MYQNDQRLESESDRQVKSLIIQIVQTIQDETNLYREMVCLSSLEYHPSLYEYASECCVQMIYNGKCSHDQILGPSFKERIKQIENHSNSGETKALNFGEVWENIYAIKNIRSADAAHEVINAWQLSDEVNNVLTDPKQKFFSVSAKIEMKPFNILHIDDNYEYKRDPLLYVTQYLLSLNDENEKPLKLNLTPQMNARLKDYGNLFFRELNKLMFWGIDLENLINPVKINHNKQLNELAEREFSALVREGIDNATNQEHTKTKIEKMGKNLGFLCVHSIIITNPRYIPPVRLLKRAEGLSDEMREKLRKKEFNEFGMKVGLFEDKSFCSLIIFAKRK